MDLSNGLVEAFAVLAFAARAFVVNVDKSDRDFLRPFPFSRSSSPPNTTFLLFENRYHKPTVMRVSPRVTTKYIQMYGDTVSLESSGIHWKKVMENSD